jgi:nucleoid-associated protein YgaU
MIFTGKMYAALMAAVMALGGGLVYFSQQKDDAAEPPAQQQALVTDTAAPATPEPDASATTPAEPQAPAATQAEPESSTAEPGATSQSDPESVPESVPESGSEAVPASVPEGQTSTDQAVVGIVPEFDILRVDESGNVVVAGRAAPGSTIEILIDSKVAGTETAGRGGEFAAVLEDPLDEGTWPVRLRATAPDGTVTESSQEVTVVFEAPGEQPLVVAQDEQGPTQVLQEAAPIAATAADAAPKGDEAAPVLIRTVDVRPPATSDAPNQVIVSGTAPAGAPIRVYLQDQQVGEASTSDSGDWVVSFSSNMSPGRYVLRADQINPDTGDVVARAQTRFRRASIVAENAPAAEQPTIEQPATEQTRAEETGAEQTATPPTNQTAGQTTGQTNGQTAASSGIDGATDSNVQRQAAAQQSNQPAEQSTTPLRGAVEDEPDISVVRGDSLWRIARNAYGQGVHYTVIFEANRSQITDPSLIFPGQVFTIPEFDAPGFDGKNAG